MALGERGSRLLWLAFILAIAAAVGGTGARWFLSTTYNPHGAGISFVPGNEFVYTSHMTFMLLGCGVLMTLAVNAHRVLPFTREGNRLVHALLHGLALISVGTAGVLIFLQKRGESHFNNVHAQLGLVLVCLLLSVYLSALCIVYLLPISARTRVWLIPYHRFFGFALYMTCMAQILMALWEKQNFTQKDVTAYWIQPMTTAAVVLAMWASIFNIYHRNAALGVQHTELDDAL